MLIDFFFPSHLSRSYIVEVLRKENGNDMLSERFSSLNFLVLSLVYLTNDENNSLLNMHVYVVFLCEDVCLVLTRTNDDCYCYSGDDDDYYCWLAR